MRINKKAYSWTIINDNTFVKSGDISFFVHQMTVIPKEIRKYWEIENMVYGDAWAVTLCFDNKEFQATIDVDRKNRTRIHWYKDLCEVFQKVAGDEMKIYPLVQFKKRDKYYYYVTLKLNEMDINSIKELLDGDYKDGRKTEVLSVHYERNLKNREAAIKAHGVQCMICGFDFGDFYGEAGKNYIEVHHLKPLSELNKATAIDPVKDLICVCSNCHSIIHRKKNGIYSPEEVVKMIEDNRKE